MSLLKKNEEIKVGQAHANTLKLDRNISKGMAVFINQKRANVCEHTTKIYFVLFVLRYFPFHVVSLLEAMLCKTLWSVSSFDRRTNFILIYLFSCF